MTRVIAPAAKATVAHRARLGALLAAKIRFLAPLTVVYLTAYVGLTVLAGFAKPVMAYKIAGPLNLGLCLILFNYALAWILALIYVRVANDAYDPEVERLRAAIDMERSR
jgi:uncharacterized membrane protein (DUF485 family)